MAVMLVTSNRLIGPSRLKTGGGVMTTIGLDKTCHPSKLFPAAPRTLPPFANREQQRKSRPFTPRLDKEWEHDAEKMSIANSLA
jgi:hypothetical protein